MSIETVLALAGFALVVLGIMIRAELRSNNNADDITDLYKQMDEHTKDRDVHHTKDDLDRRFEMLQEGQDRIEKGVEKLNDRFDVFLTNTK